MNRTGSTGEFESEVSLPVRVRFAIDAEGQVEITHVALAGGLFAQSVGPFPWQHLPLRERDALQAEAESELHHARPLPGAAGFGVRQPPAAFAGKNFPQTAPTSISAM